MYLTGVQALNTYSLTMTYIHTTDSYTIDSIYSVHRYGVYTIYGYTGIDSWPVMAS